MGQESQDDAFLGNDGCHLLRVQVGDPGVSSNSSHISLLLPSILVKWMSGSCFQERKLKFKQMLKYHQCDTDVTTRKWWKQNSHPNYIPCPKQHSRSLGIRLKLPWMELAKTLPSPTPPPFSVWVLCPQSQSPQAVTNLWHLLCCHYAVSFFLSFGLHLLKVTSSLPRTQVLILFVWLPTPCLVHSSLY